MTQTEAIRTIAEYDGWVNKPSKDIPYNFFKGTQNATIGGLGYHANIASLYFVAGRVVDDLRILSKLTQVENSPSELDLWEKCRLRICKIETALLTFSPDLTPLLMAVADGVELLKTYK